MRQLIKVRDLALFQRFIRLCAGRTGQRLNLSSLANDCGITHNTAKAWFSLLEASYILFLLPPQHRNFNKRLGSRIPAHRWDGADQHGSRGADSPSGQGDLRFSA